MLPLWIIALIIIASLSLPTGLLLLAMKQETREFYSRGENKKRERNKYHERKN